jgi:GTP:adenosylcobinamide-phosphate guanylyltransferase
MTKISHIILQAGGRGSRLEHLTENKPKALVSIHGEPLVINQMRKYPKAKFLIIADYKRDVFKKYLGLFSPSQYEIIVSEAKGTCSGIKKALKQIPDNKPFLILWCDLYFSSNILPQEISLPKYNHIGLSRTFPCRWSFKRGKLIEEKSATRGIAGLFVFKNKQQIIDIPGEGEFCRYLQQKGMQFKPFFLKNVHEVGTKDAYEEKTKNFHNTRPFNALSMKKNKIIKMAKDVQGRRLAKYESHWYDVLQKHNKHFLPKLYKTSPLTLQRIGGKSLYHYSLPLGKRKQVLTAVIDNMHELHNTLPKKRGSQSNDYEAILGKTKKRLDSIHTLIHDIDKEYIVINGKKCINFYKKWNMVEHMLKPFFGNSYSFIHGDPTFSNILYEEATSKPYFIDPRGYYGKSLLYGDEDYDWAKLYYSLIGNYDQFNSKRFRLSMNKEGNRIEIESNNWTSLEATFFEKIQRDKKKIEAYHSILWLSLTSYAWDDYDSICGAFYNGLYLMQQFKDQHTI